MPSVKTTLTKKTIAYAVATVGILGAAIGIGAVLDILPMTIGGYFTTAVIVATSMAAFMITHITRPLYKMIHEMKALMTGKAYKKMYTDRIDEFGVVANFFNEITDSLEKVTAEVKERRRLSNELNTAAEIQNDLLPKEAPSIPGLQVEAKTRPAAEIGGDCFDYIVQKDHSIIYLGDVTGHGIPSGLVMMMVHTLVKTFAHLNMPPAEILINTNRELKPRIKKAMFMTAMMLKWDHEKHEMTYSGAGHEYILIYRKKTQKVEKIPSGGIALGMLPDNSKLTKDTVLPLEAGDTVILFSDGVTEARNPEGQFYDLTGLIAAIEEIGHSGDAAKIHTHIAEKYSAFTQKHTQDDDVSLMVITYTGK